MEKSELNQYLDNVTLLLLGILFTTFPLFFLTITSDAFGLPKQILLGGITLVTLLLWSVKMVVAKHIKVRKTPFDLPVVLFFVAAALSTFFAVNKFDSAISLVTLLFAVVAYFIVVNCVRGAQSVLFLISGLVFGASLLAVNTTLSYFKIYVLPFSYAKAGNFTPAGSYLDQAMVLLLVLPIAAYLARGLMRMKTASELRATEVVFGLATLVLAVGLAVNVYGLATTFRPSILPFETGFQTAFAAISQDTGRILPGFLFGSGYGTYNTDFSRFKLPTFNASQDLWSLQFVRSSSFVLELLATTGVLGLGAFAYILLSFVRSTSAGLRKTSPLYVSVFLAFVVACVLPFSFVTTTLLFLLLGLFAATQNYSEVKFQFSAFTDAISNTSFFGSPSHGRPSVVLPIIVMVLSLIATAFLGYYGYYLVVSDIAFQKSLVAVNQNNGSQAYQLENEAITAFPYRDFYHRSFSQVNLALANSLAAQQPKDSSPSAEMQQTIYTLIQQSINAGRNATAVAPQTSTNWSNLSSIYRSLIGFGQNADSFSVLTAQQSTALDPNNPNEYVALGGIYLQLKQYDNAVRQFQVAVNLKPDFANAYYNLGHALEAKGDLQNALVQYNAVKTLVAKDKAATEQIGKEIDALQQKIGTTDTGSNSTAAGKTDTQPELEVNKPQAQLPAQPTPVQLPAPSTATASAK